MKRHEIVALTESPEAETSLKEGHRDWASLPLPVVDKVIRVLKDTRRWRLDGRSLRLVNRHWSAAVTMHVEEIRPDFTRSIVDKDIASLPKFERATSMDLSAFLIRPPKHELPRNRKQKKVFLENWYDTKLETIVDVLCQMPRLTQIEVGLKTMIILQRQCLKTKEHFSRLDRISSVYLYGCHNLRLYGKTPWNTNWNWLDDSLWRLDYSSVLTHLVSSLCRLETLEVEGKGPVLDSRTYSGFLDKVKHVAHVTLKDVDSRILTKMSNPSSTVSSVIEFGGARFTQVFPFQLTRLDRLRLMKVEQDDLDQLPLTPAAEYLKVLDMDGYHERAEFVQLVFPRRTITTFRQLECLNIKECYFVGESLRGNFLNLKALRIEGCTLRDNDVMFVTQFRELELLNWVGVHNPKYRSLYLPWKELKLPKLRSLSVSPILNDSELQSISQQTNLEVLHIGSRSDKCTSNITNEGIHLLEELPKLRSLYIDACGVSERGKWSSLLSTNFVTKLEQLWTWIYPVYDEGEDNLERIKCISPHLILKSIWCPFPSFAPMHFDSACFV